MRAKALRKDRAGFQMVSGAKEIGREKPVTKWIPTSDEAIRQKVQSYCRDVLQWNKSGTPSNERLEQEIEYYWDKLPAVNMFLSDCGLLQDFNAETLGSLFEAWRKGSNPKLRTLLARQRTWKLVCQEWGNTYPLRKLNSAKIKQIYNLFVFGKYSSYVRNGEEISKKPTTKRNDLQSIQAILAYAKKVNLISRTLDIGIEDQDPTCGDTRLLARPKQYISIARFNNWMDRLTDYPDLRLFFLMIRSIGYRPEALWKRQLWEDLVFPADDPTSPPIQIRRVFGKTANKRTTRSNEAAIDHVLLDLPEVVANELQRYRTALLHMKANPSSYPLYDRTKMPHICPNTGWIRGRLFWNWSLGSGNSLLKSRVFPAIGEDYFTAMPTHLRASAARNIQDIGGNQVESAYLKHGELAKNRHYIGTVMHDAPPPLERLPDGAFIKNYDTFWSIGEQYYDSRSISQAYLLERSKSSSTHTFIEE